LGAWIPPIVYKPKHSRKGGIQGTKWKDPCPRRQNYHLRQSTTMGTSSSQTPSCSPISISNKEREGPSIPKKKKNSGMLIA
jgi:hypothetical protein